MRLARACSHGPFKQLPASRICSASCVSARRLPEYHGRRGFGCRRRKAQPIGLTVQLTRNKVAMNTEYTLHEEPSSFPKRNANGKFGEEHLRAGRPTRVF